jgi:hypothetical protein
MSIKMVIVALAVGAASLGAAACGDDDDDSGSASAPAATTTEADSSSSASVSFVEPMDGATTGDTVTANVELEGFQIDAADVGKANKAGAGHLHFSLDEGKFDTPKYSGANGKLAVQLGVDGMYSPATAPTITYSGLPPGEHTLEVDLVNNDHSETGTSATTTFTVE